MTASKTCLAVVIAALTLAGCSDVWVDDAPPPRYSYNNGDFEYANHRGAILTQIVGNPFNIPDDQFRRAALAYMQGQNRGTPAKFVLTPSTETLPPYKVVAAFNLPADYTGYELCKGPGALPRTPKRTGPVTLAMAFCFGDEVKSDARGSVADLRGINDPRFKELVNRVTEAMLPAGDGMEMFDDGGSVP
jgi:hypothetical protein